MQKRKIQVLQNVRPRRIDFTLPQARMFCLAAVLKYNFISRATVASAINPEMKSNHVVLLRCRVEVQFHFTGDSRVCYQP